MPRDGAIIFGDLIVAAAIADRASDPLGSIIVAGDRPAVILLGQVAELPSGRCRIVRSRLLDHAEIDRRVEHGGRRLDHQHVSAVLAEMAAKSRWPIIRTGTRWCSTCWTSWGR